MRTESSFRSLKILRTRRWETAAWAVWPRVFWIQPQRRISHWMGMESATDTACLSSILKMDSRGKQRMTGSGLAILGPSGKKARRSGSTLKISGYMRFRTIRLLLDTVENESIHFAFGSLNPSMALIFSCSMNRNMTVPCLSEMRLRRSRAFCIQTMIQTRGSVCA